MYPVRRTYYPSVIVLPEQGSNGCIGPLIWLNPHVRTGAHVVAIFICKGRVRIYRRSVVNVAYNAEVGLC